MARWSFGLRQLFFWTAAIALGLVALRSASTTWVAAMLGLILLTMTAAILFAMFRQGAERAYWIGFTTFGWMYLLLLFAGWSQQTTDAADTPLRPYNLVTTQISNACYHWLYDAAFATYYNGLRLGGGLGSGGYGGMGSGAMGPVGGSGMGMSGMVSAQPPAPGPNETDFANVAHALWTVLLAACGGWLAHWLYSTGRKGDESPPP